MDNKNNDPSNKPLPSLADIAKEAYKNKDNVPSTYSPGISSDTTLKEASTLLGDNNRFGGAYFKQNLDNAIKTKAYQEAKAKAAEQGILGEAAASLNQAVVGEIIGGTIDGIGYLFDWDQVDTLKNGEETFGSWLSEIGTDIRDWSKEATPVYVDPDVQAKGFDMGSSEWYFSNLPSVLSALSIMIPVAGEAKAVSLVGQGLKATKGLAQLGKMGKSAKTVANILDKTIDAFRLTEKGLSEGAKLTVQGLHRAAVSTHIEAGMESVGAYKEEYQRLLNSGLSDSEAKRLAGETGSFVYKTNWANFATEFMQQMLLLKNGPQLTKGVIGGAEAEAAGLSKKVGRINAVKEYAKQMLSEGAEEAYQHIITQEGKYLADVKAGLVEESSFGDRLAKYTKDGELWTAAFFGGLGGAVFHKFGNKAIAGVNRLVTGVEKGLTAQQARIEELKSQHTRALQAAKNLGEAKESGNTESIIHAENDMALTLGVNAAKNQTLDYMLDRFNNLKNLSKEEREANKIDDNFVESIDKYSKSITQAAALYAENVDRYGADMAESITYREYHLEKLNEQLPRVRKEYDHAVTSLPRYTETTIEGRKLIDETMKLASLHQNKMIIEHVLKTGEMTSQERETQEKNVEILGKAIELTNTQLSEMTKNTTHLLNDADQLVLANLDSKFGQNVLSAKIKNDSYDLRIKNLTDELSFLTSKAGQEQIRKQREDNIKKQQAKQEDKATVEDSEYANENTYTEGVQIAMNGPALEKAIAEGKITEEQIMKIPEAKKVWEAYRKGETLQDTAEEEQKTEKEITEEYSDEGGEGTLFDFPLDNEITEKDKTKGKETITFASNIDEVETPEDSDKEYQIKGPEVNMENSVFTDADETILLSTASALAWKSFNNSQAEDKDFTEQNKAFANFVENPLISLNGLEVRFSIDYENEAFKKQYKGTSPLGEMVGSIKNGKIPENIGLVPIKATFFKNGSPVTSNGHKMEAYLHRDDYAKFKDDSSREEIRRQKNIIVENLLKGNVVSTTLKEKNNGHLRTSKNKETKKFDKRPITEIFPDLKNVEFTIGSNGRKVDPATKQIDGDILGTNTTDGAIYLTVKTANNNKFPLRCNVEKLSIAEAEVIHAIYVSILKDPSTYKQNISPELIKFITENKDERIKDINTYIDLNNISNQDLLDHLVFNGTTKTGHAEGNKLFHTTKNELVFGNKMLPGGVIETEESKAEIIKFLTEKRRRQISVKYLSDDKFKKYIVERGILTTNAVPTENKRLFVQPLLTYDSNFNISKPTVVTKKQENVTKPQSVLLKFANVGFIGYDKKGNKYEVISKKDKYGRSLEYTINDGELRVFNPKTVSERDNTPAFTELFSEKPTPISDNTKKTDIETPKSSIDLKPFVVGNEIRNAVDNSVLHTFNTPQEAVTFFETTYLKDIKIETPKVEKQPLAVSEPILQDAFKEEREALENPIAAESEDFDEDSLNEGTLFDINAFLPSEQTLTPEEVNNIKEDPKEETDIDKLADEGSKLNEEEGGSVFDPGRWKLVDGNLIKDAKPNYNTFNKEVEHIKSLLPSKIAVKLADDYLQVLSNGRVAIGLFKDNMIHLSKKATEGTAYHEAFHAVYRTMLSYKEQNALYKEASKNYVKYTEQDIKDLMVLHQVQRQDAIEIFYEEQMADDFMDFMKDPNKFSYSKGIKGLFERLLDWLNHVFLNSITRRKLFNDISTGKYKNKPVRLSRGVAYKTTEGLQIMPKTGDGFNPQDVPDIIRQLSFIILTSKYPEVKASSREEAKKITKELEIKAIKDELKKLIARNKKEGNEELTYRTFKVFNNLTDLYYLTTEYIESLGLSQEVENQGEDADGNIIYKPSYELSGKENASRQIKMMIALIPKFKVYEVDNFKNRIPDLNTYLGLPKFENFNSVWNRLEKHLTGIVPIKRAGVEVPMFDLMIEKLGEMGKYHPSLAYLKGKLLNTDSFTKSQFTNAFGRYNGVYMDTLVSGKPGNFVYKHANSDLLNVTNNIAKTWSNNFVKNFGIQNNEGKLVYNEAALKQLAFFHNELNMSLLNDKKSRKVSEKSIGLLGAELAFLGIDISEKAIEKLINDEKSKIERTNNEDHDLLKVYDNIFYKLNQALVSSANYKSLIATKNAAARSGELTEETNHILDQTFFKETLAEAEAEFIEVQGENTIPGPDGTTKWISQDHSLMSIILAQVKLGDTSLLESLAKLPFNQSSKWINDLINKPELRQKVKLVNYNNYKLEKKNDGGNKAKDLKEPDQLNDSINKYLNGIYVGLAEADKSQQFYIQGFDLENSQVLFKDGKVDVSGNNAVNILYKYFTSEVNRMVVAYNHLYNKDEKQRLKPEDEIIHYHYKKTPGDKQGNWKISYLFPNMDLQAMGILKYSADETKKDELIAVNGIETLKPEQITEIQKYIKEQFINAVQNDLKILNRYKIIKYQNNTFNNLTIDSNIISSKYQGDVTHAVGDYTLNSIIANVEFQKLFTQDPALFKNKGDIFEDYKKRIPLITASGKLQRIFKEGLYEVREHYQSAVIQNIETPSKYFSDPKNIRAISLATEISEDEIKDMFLGNEWRENKLGAYGKVNQTDAQAWITIDLYRERMLGFGKWSDAMENSFKKIKEGSDTFEDNALFAQPLKTVHSEIVILNGVATTQYNKQSEAVLLPKLVKGTKMQNILDAMIAQKIDHIITLDGKKVGARGIAKILNDETKEILPSSEIKLHPTTLSNKFLFLQQDLPHKGLEKPTLVGSQMTKNVLSMLVLTDDYEGMRGIEVYGKYNKTLSNLSDLGLIEFQDKIGYSKTQDKITDKPKFNKEMAKAIKDVASDNIINGLINNLNINTLFQFKNKLENKLGSMVTRASVKQKQPGGSMIYMSNFGMENTTVKLSDKIVKDEIIWFKKPNEELTPARIVENNSLNSEENTIFVELKKELENKELTEDQKALLGEKVLNELEPSQENMGLLIKIHCK